MYNAVLVVLWAGASFILYKIVAYILTEIHYRKQAKIFGCQPPYQFKLWDFQGIRNAQWVLAADKRMAIPDYLKARVDNACADEGRSIWTFGMKLLGAPSIFTNDPKNVQAVLATQFKDFGMGVRRNGNFSALLGQGIVRSCCRLLAAISLLQY